MFKWFDTRETKEEACAIAGQLHEVLADEPAAGRKAKRAASPEKELKRLESIVSRAFNFVSEKKLNFYKKAVFLNTLRWELKRLGHEDAVAEKVVRELATRF